MTLLVGCLVASQTAVARGSLFAGEVDLDEPEANEKVLMLQALDEVLARLTGRFDAPLRPDWAVDPDAVGALVLSRQRIAVELIDDQGQAEEQLRLQVEFDAEAIDELLARQGMARLGPERPVILLWVALDDADGARMDFGQFAALDGWLREQSRRLGLTILRPLGDGLDLADVTLADIRGGFLDAAGVAAERYRADLIAMLDLRRTGEQWTGRWVWRIAGSDQSRLLMADGPSEVVRRGLEAVHQSLVERYAVVPGLGTARLVRLVVDGIDRAAHFAEVMTHLEGLSAVSEVTLRSASGRRIELELSVRGEGLEDALELTRLLEVDERRADGTLIVHLRP